MLHCLFLKNKLKLHYTCHVYLISSIDHHPLFWIKKKKSNLLAKTLTRTDSHPHTTRGTFLLHSYTFAAQAFTKVYRICVTEGLVLAFNSHGPVPYSAKVMSCRLILELWNRTHYGSQKHCYNEEGKSKNGQRECLVNSNMIHKHVLKRNTHKEKNKGATK